MLLLFLFNAAAYGGCPSKYKVQALVSGPLKLPFVVKSVKEIKGFPLCEVETESGDTLFITKDCRFLVEGTLLKVPSIRFSRKELQLLKKKALFEAGEGKEELIVLTNPACKACLSHREELKGLEKRYKLFVVPVGFGGEEFKAAVDAYCRKKGPKNFFKPEKAFKLCNEGKLRVWSLQAFLKRKGITGTPVFVREDGTPLFGASALKELLSGRE